MLSWGMSSFRSVPPARMADMTQIARFALASVVSIAILGAMLSVSGPAQAMTGYTVSVAAVSDTVAPGEMATFRVRVEGQTTSLPSFTFDVDGGSLAGVASIDPIAANVAEGTVFVRRESEGTARLSVRFGGETLATAEARFANLGAVDIAVALDAGPDAAARTWRFEVVTPGGQVVASLSASTSGDAPIDTVSTRGLPYGFYTVRQVLGNDTATSCEGGAFYRVAAPNGAQTTIELASTGARVSFQIVPCAALPAGLEVDIPVDTLAPAAGSVGDPDVLPGETPVSEVRGARQAGPGNPLPPRTGNTAPATPSNSNLVLLVLAIGAAATFFPAATFSASRVRGWRKR